MKDIYEHIIKKNPQQNRIRIGHYSEKMGIEKWSRIEASRGKTGNVHFGECLLLPVSPRRNDEVKNK